MKQLRNVFFISLLCFSQASLAWWEAGHMAVADIAYHHLSSKAKAEVKKLLPLMAIESTHRNDYSYNDKQPNYTMMVIAHWADDLNNYPNYFKLFKTWHYIQDAYSLDGTEIPKEIPRDNVVWAIHNLRAHLAQEKGNDYDRARSLALLIHFVGDIHQPLHCAELYSEDFPDGDRGGNSYHVYYKEPTGEKINNLHMLLDSGVKLFPNLGYSHNVSAASDVDAISKLIMQDYPKAYFGKSVSDLDPEHWEEHSHELAKAAHETPYGKTPSESYLDEQTKMAEQQIAIAGYRLAGLLNQVLG